MKLSDNELEKLESNYLNKYYHFLSSLQKELLIGLNSKNKIRDFWYDSWYKSNRTEQKQSFSVGAERVFYSFLNSKAIGEVNSAPVSSDLMFEVEDAFIHIDLKTVQINNIGDINSSIFIGNNQTSYNGGIYVDNELLEYKDAQLPMYYKYDNFEKPCLTYFITILHEETNFETLMINIICMPNGQLHDLYKTNVLKAGKTRDDEMRKDGYVSSVRFNFSKCLDFKTLPNKKRVKIIYLKNDLDSEISKKLKILNDLYKQQGDS